MDYNVIVIVRSATSTVDRLVSIYCSTGRRFTEARSYSIFPTEFSHYSFSTVLVSTLGNLINNRPLTTFCLLSTHAETPRKSEDTSELVMQEIEICDSSCW